MARVKFYLDSKPTKDGRCHVKLTITHNGGSALMSTGVFVKPEFWEAGDNETDPHVKKTCPGAKTMNAILVEKLETVQGRLNALVLDGSVLTLKTATDVKNRIQDTLDGKNREDGLVAVHFEKFIARRNKTGTANAYRETLAKIAKYSDIGKLHFEDITVAWLKTFETKLRRDGLAVNSVARHLRDIRAVYNDAIDYDVASLATYPFRRFKITHEATAKRSLTIEQLRQLRDYPCEPHQEKYRDLFMLIFYLGGINMIDLLKLPPGTNYWSRLRLSRRCGIRSLSVTRCSCR